MDKSKNPKQKNKNRKRVCPGEMKPTDLTLSEMFAKLRRSFAMDYVSPEQADLWERIKRGIEK